MSLSQYKESVAANAESILPEIVIGIRIIGSADTVIKPSHYSVKKMKYIKPYFFNYTKIHSVLLSCRISSQKKQALIIRVVFILILYVL